MGQEVTGRTCETLILLVGSNPLPNYLTATLLRPKKLVLIHTPETRGPAERLASVLANQTKIEMRGLAKASDGREIADAVRCIISDGDAQQVHLNYTGGTKIMAAHARMAFRKIRGRDQNTSYLDDKAQCLFFDDGLVESLENRDLSLTLDLLGQLHGCKKLPPRDDRDGLAEEEARIVAAKVAGDPKFARKMDDGRWLEIAVAAWIRDVTSLSPAQGVYWKLEGRRFEIDVALIRGHRLYVVSCATDKKLKQCKGNLFEVAMRARQLGGDLARSAVVCLIDGQDSNGRYIDQLRGDVASVWEAPNKPYSGPQNSDQAIS